jgi:hypothetical protein
MTARSQDRLAARLKVVDERIARARWQVLQLDQRRDMWGH